MKDTIQLNTGRASVLLVSLPEGAKDIQLSLLCHNLIYFERVDDEDYHWSWYEKRFIELPPGNWIEVGWSDFLSEKQAAELVEKHSIVKDKFKLYAKDEFTSDIFNKFVDAHRWANTTLESWKSLLSSNGIEGRKYVLKDNNK